MTRIRVDALTRLASTTTLPSPHATSEALNQDDYSRGGESID